MSQPFDVAQLAKPRRRECADQVRVDEVGKFRIEKDIERHVHYVFLNCVYANFIQGANTATHSHQQTKIQVITMTSAPK